MSTSGEINKKNGDLRARETPTCFTCVRVKETECLERQVLCLLCYYYINCVCVCAKEVECLEKPSVESDYPE